MAGPAKFDLEAFLDALEQAIDGRRAAVAAGAPGQHGVVVTTTQELVAALEAAHLTQDVVVVAEGVPPLLVSAQAVDLAASGVIAARDVSWFLYRDAEQTVLLEAAPSQSGTGPGAA